MAVGENDGVDPPAGNQVSAEAPAIPVEKKNALNQSLSSTFFQGLRSARNSNTNSSENAAESVSLRDVKRSEIEETDQHDDLPPPPSVGATANDRSNVGDEEPRPNSSSVELKRRETLAAVNQMKDRLRGMGLLRAGSEQLTKDRDGSEATNETQASSVDLIAPSDLSASQLLSQQLKERTEKCRKAMRYVSDCHELLCCFARFQQRLI